MLEPSTPVQYVKGIGPHLGEILASKGIRTVEDLLHYLPFRYEDRRNPRAVSQLRPGEMAPRRRQNDAREGGQGPRSFLAAE
jgi:RecG-like helicase